ncbi:MAG TPA: LysR family transcriptional regulator [Aggregicoccus sp.]|nr:LysR family transcriptional regulator [Aggregicoccus sp.]
MFDTDLLKTFVTVAEEEGFTRAATRLALTQSAVSAQIKRLEEQAGCALLTRTTRSVALTVQGEVLLSYARNILALQAEVSVRLGLGTHVSGPLRVGISEGFLTGPLAQLLQRFTTEHPAVRTEVHVGGTSMLLEELEAGRLEVVLGVHCGDAPGAEELWSEPLVWAYSAALPLPDGPLLPLALFPKGCPYREAALSALLSRELPWRLACVSFSAASTGAAATLGLGLSPMPRSQLTALLRDVTAEAGLPELPAARLSLWRGDGARSSAVELFVQTVRQQGVRPGAPTLP